MSRNNCTLSKSALLVALSAFTLTGCGSDTEINLSVQGIQEVDFDSAELFVFNTKEQNLFDKQYFDKVYDLLKEDEFIFSSNSLEHSEKAVFDLTKRKEGILNLPISESLKSEYSATIDKAIAEQKKHITLFKDLYPNGLHHYYTQKYPKVMNTISEAEKRKANREVYLKEADDKYSSAKLAYKNKYNETEALIDALENKGKDFVTNNEIAISKSKVSFYDVIYQPVNSTDSGKCESMDDGGAVVFVKQTGLCHSVRLINNTDIDDFTESQKLAFINLVKQHEKEITDSAINQSILKVFAGRANSELNKKITLADNRFGSKNDIREGIFDAKRELNSVSRGVYNLRTNNYITLEPGKTSRALRALDHVIKEIKINNHLQTYGDYTTSQSAFNIDNAYQAMTEIMDHAVKQATVITEVSSDGSLNLGDTSQESLKVIRASFTTKENGKEKTKALVAKLSDSGKRDDGRELSAADFSGNSIVKSDNLLLLTEITNSRNNPFYDKDGRRISFSRYIYNILNS